MDRPRVYVTWDQEDEVFPARLTRNPDGSIQTWNGFVCPEFDRATAERLVAVNDSFVRELGRDAADAFRWYGDVLVSRWCGHDVEVDWPESLPQGEASTLDEPFSVVARTSDGRYPIGSWAWTWTDVPTQPHDFLPRADARGARAYKNEDVPADACVFCGAADGGAIHEWVGP